MNVEQEQLLESTGREATDLLMPGCDWVHRRVQRVSFLEPALVQVGLSVDFTSPDDAQGAYVPVSVLPKWPPLYRFDFKRSDGASIPLLTSAQNGLADKALLLGLVEEASPSSLGDESFLKVVKKLSLGTETNLLPAVDAFEDGLVGDPEDPKVERVLDVASMLADATFLWYPVEEGDLGQRTICKVNYLIQSPEPRWHSVSFAPCLGIRVLSTSH